MSPDMKDTLKSFATILVAVAIVLAVRDNLPNQSFSIKKA
jgi:hypothetical protein